jgi:hypothetical protein
MNLPPSLRNKMHQGLHVASFCDGAVASQKVFADELLDLWRNPISIGKKTYYVVVSQILMDGPGCTKYTRTRSTNSHEGCNICQHPARTFGKRRVYDGFRSYSAINDPRRKKKSKHNVLPPPTTVDTSITLQWAFDEVRPPPQRRTYVEYVDSAAEAAENVRKKNAPRATTEEKKLPAHIRGVYAMWCLFILPYADLIHWTVDMMHSFSNVIKDLIDSLRPTASAIAGIYYKHTNRTYKPDVVADCQRAHIFPNLILLNKTTNKRPPWVLKKSTCIDIDKQMANILGAYMNDDIPQHIMRAGKCEKSHDTIQWAHIFGNWCLRDRGVYTDNILKIFEFMSVMNGSRIHAATVVESILPDLLEALLVRSGIVPPTECCVTLHELIHIGEQVSQIGNARHSTLYKFEKVNKIMKGFVQNHALGNHINKVYMAYIIHVFCTVLMCFILMLCRYFGNEVFLQFLTMCLQLSYNLCTMFYNFLLFFTIYVFFFTKT